MNRSIYNVLFGSIAAPSKSDRKTEGTVTSTTTDEVVETLLAAETVFIAPGYGMAVSKAQYALADIVKALKARGVTARFAVHPVAGRMPGQSASQSSLWLGESEVTIAQSMSCSRKRASRTMTCSRWTRRIRSCRKQMSV